MVTEQQYREAISRLYPLAMRNTGSARTAAQVLLSCYSPSVLVAIPDLCNLDKKPLDDCMTVINGRVYLKREPHYMFPNEPNLFVALVEEWPGLITNNRVKVSCYECYEEGEIFNENEAKDEKCIACDGRGWSWPEEE